MASATPITDKSGKVIAYRIRVYRGKDANGKKLNDYSMNWAIPETYKSEKAILRELEKVKNRFELDCQNGNIPVEHKTFSEYAKYFVEMRKAGTKEKTHEYYNNLLPRIDEEIGSIKLERLTAAHLNKFYLKLQNDGVKNDYKAVANDKLLELKQKNKYTLKKIAELSGLAENTVQIAFKQRKIALTSAEKLAAALGGKKDELFTFESSSGGGGLSPKYIKEYHNFIHSVLEQAMFEGLVGKNVANLASPPRAKRHEADFFEIEDILRIRECLEQEDFKHRIAVYLLIDTGIRRGELFGLRWSVVDFKACTIKIDRNIQWSKEKGLYVDSPKNNEYRTVSIAPEIAEQLKLYQKHQKKEAVLLCSDFDNEFDRKFASKHFNPEGYLFTNEDGNVMHPSSLNHWLTRFEKKYNLPHIHPHKFRHSQASILYSSNVDIVTISKRLGHKQVSTTQNIYAHLMAESDKKASDKIADILYRNKTSG